MAGLLEALRIRRATAPVQPPPTAAAPPPAVPTPPGTSAPGEQAPVTAESILASILAQRPNLVTRFQSDAILFANDQRVARKIFPEAEARVAFKYLTAAVDDASYGGQVVFCRRNALGELEEAQGTRVEQLRQEYADALPHSLADELVMSMQNGTVPGGQAFALPATPPPPQGATTAAAQAQTNSDPGTDMKVEDVLGANDAGKRVLARQQDGHNGAGANGAA
jgi:hypothetical protein